MAIRYFALTYGIVFLLVGIAGFIPAFVAPYDASHPQLTVNSGAGLLFGLFPVNILHNLTHAIFGLWGLLVWRSLGAARAYARAVALIYGVFVLLGLVPGLMTLFGLVPLHGHDIWLHLLLAGVAAYFGFAHEADRPVRVPVGGSSGQGNGSVSATPPRSGDSYSQTQVPPGQASAPASSYASGASPTVTPDPGSKAAAPGTSAESHRTRRM